MTATLPGPTPSTANRLGTPRRRVVRVPLPEETTPQAMTAQPVGRPTSGVVAVVPAHNEEAGIADVITDLQRQTLPPDRIVVIVNNSTDRTAAIARSFGDVDVVDMPDNKHKKVGALIESWGIVGQQHPYWLGVDADTRLDPDCIRQLRDELQADDKLAGVMARYTFDQPSADKQGPIASLLVFAQRLEFAGWIDDLLHRKRETYVLGGQASLFRTSALAQVAARDDRESPWTTTTLVEDMELTWQLKDAGWKVRVSAEARAYAGPMTAIRSLWGQRSKWDYGLAKLLHDRRGLRDASTRYPWRLQSKMLLDFSLRAMFVVQLFAAWLLAAFTWYWVWIFPPVWASLLNLRLAGAMPNRRKRDLFLAGTLIVPELFLWLRLACWVRCWFKVLTHQGFDGWSAQYEAERKAVRS
ncbi:glycosyltransferase [uncultured Jatrophihabitans sp.]|uniref:glycosyltransferase n=1 Tax=uncultured Jatrophihabitans sp. TaxID=1610747 RepID=UPI0035CB2840